MIEPTPEEIERRTAVIRAILEATATNTTVKLPDFDPKFSVPSQSVAYASVGVEPNPYGGTVGKFRYQFEGEEDLLHLIVTRTDQSEISVPEGQFVAGFLLEGVPTALFWFRPGTVSQHYFVGHDDVEKYVVR